MSIITPFIPKTMTIYLIADEQTFPQVEIIFHYLDKKLPNHVKVRIFQYIENQSDIWTWDGLFSVGKNAKQVINQPDEENYFVFLYHGLNIYNWFASYDLEDSSIGFLQCSDWDKVGVAKPKFAIIYHLLAIVTAMKFFGDDKEPFEFYHEKSIGCMFDLTQNKEEVIYKLKSADICPSCVKKIAAKSMGEIHSFSFMKSVKEILEEVRDNLFRVEWNVFFDEYDYQLIVNEDLTLDLKINEEQIHLPISKGREAAVFMMILKHENGLSYKDFEKPQFKREYLALYHRYFVKNDSLEALIKQADIEIEQKTYQSNLQAIISKVRRKLTQKLKQYPDIQKQLLIQTSEAGLTIPINRKRLVPKVPELLKVG